jgi:hypothetical protein
VVVPVGFEQQPGEAARVVPDHVVVGQPGEVRRRRYVERVDAGGGHGGAGPGPALGVLLGRERLRPVDLVLEVLRHGIFP